MRYNRMMTVESRIHRVLSGTKRLLEADIEERRKEVIDISKQGAEIWEGDQWHSTAYRHQQLKKELAIRYLQLIDQSQGKIETLNKPIQNDYIEIGHMVKVRLLDDMEVIESGIQFSLVHVLTKEDSLYLGGKLDNTNQLIVSNESPLGKTLLGLKRGNSAIYLNDNRLQVLDDEDAIVASSFFED